MATYQEEKSTILLVDDDADNIELIYSTLSPVHAVLTADGSSDVLDIACSEMPALIIINVTLPDLDGYELCRRLNADSATAEIPIILLAPSIDTAVEASAFAASASDIMPLPLDANVVSHRVAMQLGLKRCREEHEEFKGIDPITGLANRQRFDAQLNNEWLRGVRSCKYLSLLVFEIDEFTVYNNHYGHDAGNECLRRITQILSEELHRSSDRLARFSDDQFACTLPDTDYEGALQLAERIRLDIDRRQLEHAESTIANHLTVSAGLASMVPTEDANIYTLINAARHYLYEAKHYGGNRVMGCLHPPLPPSEVP